MLKRIFSILFVLLFANLSASFAQKGKAELSLAYGYYSSFTLYQGAPFNASTGTPNINLRYYMTNRFTLGLGIGFENNRNYGSFLTFAPEATVAYMDMKDAKVRVKIYGALAYGLTVFNDNNNNVGHDNQTGGKPWGFQFTPFGIRVGRKIAGFAEVGYGYKGLINAGLSYRFKPVHIKVPQ